LFDNKKYDFENKKGLEKNNIICEKKRVILFIQIVKFVTNTDNKNSKV
jgi:hypothetical protein